jgi:hypothetical protein
MSVFKSKQEVFDFVAKKLIEQGQKSASSKADGCAYRGDYGRKCAIGWLIPDSNYDPDIEGNTWAKIVGTFPSVSAAVLDQIDPAVDINHGFFTYLQNCHDLADDGDDCDYTDPDEWVSGLRARLRNFAAFYNLNSNILDHP